LLKTPKKFSKLQSSIRRRFQTAKGPYPYPRRNRHPRKRLQIRRLHLNLKAPNRYYTEFNFAGQPEIFAYNGKSAWCEDGNGEIGTLLGPEAIQMETLALLSNSHFLDRKKNKLAVVSTAARN